VIEPPLRPGSTIRTIAGGVCLVASLVVLPAGFIQMVRALEMGGYATGGVTFALWWLGAGGGLLGMGIALLIWEMSVRHGIRH
jgi:hypothetical protein